MSSLSSQEERIAFVTGANRGLGFEVSRQLGVLGYTVLLGCRGEQRGLEAEQRLRKEGRVEYIKLDVTSQSTIDAAVTAGALHP